MYSTCIFCHAKLGTNEAIEHFPVGRRLAFDAAKGRLWVVCRACERWNLTPIEERWEAIEECERAFSSTRLRVSTDNIGMARLRDGTELVRIGSPLRPEMAAWRYGDQFGRRRKKYMLYAGAGVTAVGGLVILGPVTGLIATGGAAAGIWNMVNAFNTLYRQQRVRARIPLPGIEKPVILRLHQLARASIVPQDDGWALRVPYRREGGDLVELSNGRKLQTMQWADRSEEHSTVLTGDAALAVAAKLLPKINASGASRDQVGHAIRLMDEVPAPEALFSRFAAHGVIYNRRIVNANANAEEGNPIMGLPREVRLALEMATHESSERRALEGELSLLQDEWQRAEEIAAIADDLLVPGETRSRFARLRRSTEE